jgi:plastocyanin
VEIDMTAISKYAKTNAQVEPSRPARTYAMILVGAGCWALAAGLAYFLVYVIVVYAPGIGDELLVGEVLPIFASIAAILGGLGILAVVWPGARRHAWFWLVPVVLAILLMAMNASDIPYDLARPANTGPFVLTIVVLVGALAAIVGGVVAFFEVRLGRPLSVRSGRAVWSTAAVAGILAGAAMTSLLAGRESARGEGAVEVPTGIQVVTIQAQRFVENSLTMKNGQVLGLLVVNPTDVAHSFDIDSLDVHVLLPANSTTAVTIHPREPGTLAFYCSVHGHRAAGMVGKVTVE